MKLDKQEILDRTDGGLEIFARLIPDLKLPVKKGQHFHSVLREEKTPSANLFKNRTSGWWMYKDLGDTGKAMNAIDLLMAVHKVEFKEALQMAADLANLMPADFVRQPMAPEVIMKPDPQQSASIAKDTGSQFHAWARSLGISDQHLTNYGVGTFRIKGRAFTCFVFYNFDGEAVNWKWLSYLENGHRDKEVKPKSLVGKNPGEVYRLCLFGEHLLKGNQTKPICIVESEKSAVLAASFYPEYIWLATAGLNGSNKEDFIRLGLADGQTIRVFCDADPIRKIPKAFQILEELKANVRLIDLMPERTDKSDIADYLSEGLRPEILDTYTLPDWAKPAEEKEPELEKEPGTENEVKERIKRLTKLRGDYEFESEEYDGIQYQIDQLRARLKKVNGVKVTVKLNGEEIEEKEESEWARFYREEQEEKIKSLIPPDAYDEDGNDPMEDAIQYSWFRFGGCFWAIQSKPTPKGMVYWKIQMTNFTMRILFHMEGKNRTSRLIEFRNCYGQSRTIETDTANLVSKAKFKEITEALGNYLFFAGDTELMNLKSKLFKNETPCVMVEILGQNSEGFFAFSNGIYQKGNWLPVDEKGIIILEKSALYIPSGNRNYASNSEMYTGEKKVKHTPTKVSFKDWAERHHVVFGEPGMVGMLFGISCLFSDIVFQNFNFFPLLFLYGEGGSGKGELIRSIQHLFGQPQDPLHLSGKANTDKARIRELAQYRNLVMCLEEYRNGNDDLVNMLKQVWDRFGYKRARMDRGVGNESVPINSGAMVTGNDYPMDDALLQRLVVLELNKNVRTQEMSDAFYALKQYQEAGITSITLQLLDHRELVESTFRDTYMNSLKEIRTTMANTKITDRMASNMAVIEAMYVILSKVLEFPFSLEKLKEFMATAMKRQNSKRDSGSETQKFWDVILSMATRGEIIENREIKFDGDKVFVRFTELHYQYMLGHRQMYGQPGLNKQSLLDKLKISDAYEAPKDSVRFGEERTSAQVFFLSKIGIDLVGAFEYKRRQAQAKLQEIADAEKAREEQSQTVAPEPVQLKIGDDDLPF